jgi:uncharacterized protein (DUF1330 family)
MSAYFVVYLNVTDPEQFSNYFQAVMPVIEPRGGRSDRYEVRTTLKLIRQTN